MRLSISHSWHTAKLEAVGRHQCLRFRHGFGASWALSNGKRNIDLPIQGMGIALLLDVIAQADVAEGKLQRILPKWQGQPVPVYAVTTTRLLPAKIRAFIDFLRGYLQAGESVS